jgi:hypothetical protein
MPPVRTLRIPRVEAFLVSEMGHLAERGKNAFLLGAEIDEQGGFSLDRGDLAETVHVVDHSVTDGELIARRSDRGLEGTVGETALRYR